MKPFTILSALVLAAPAMAADVLFISVAGEKRIAVYSVETKNGRLAAVGDIKTAGEPGALAIDEKKRFLFAALRSTGDLAAFRIDKKNGQLTHINTIVGGADPVYLTVDKEGKYLLTAYYGPGKVTVHKISENGALSKEPHQTVKTKDKAHAVVFNPHGGEALIPQTESNIISSFSWNAKEGKLSNKFDAQMPKNTGPAHLVFYPSLSAGLALDDSYYVCYVANEQGNSVTLYRAIMSPVNLGLHPLQTVPTLPASFKGPSACGEIRLHPSNRFLYVLNRGHDSIAGFQLDTDPLTILGQTPTEKVARSFDFDPSGRYLYAVGESSGNVSAYLIDESSGKLERTEAYAIGKKLWSVLSARLPGE